MATKAHRKEDSAIASCLYALFKSKDLPLIFAPPLLFRIVNSKAATKSIDCGFGDSEHCTVWLTLLADKSSIRRIFPGCRSPKRLLIIASAGRLAISMGPDAHHSSTSSWVFFQTSSSISGSPDDLQL